MSAAHVIENLEFDIRFDNQVSAFEQQERLAAFLKGRAMRVMEELFDRACAAEDVLSFETLELDLGAIAVGELESGFEMRLRQRLELALADGLRQARETSPSNGAPLLRSAQEAEFDAFTHFLAIGHFSWRRVPGVPVSVASLAAHVLATRGVELAQWVVASPVRIDAIRRMVSHCDDAWLEALLGRLGVAWASDAVAVMKRLRSAYGSVGGSQPVAWRDAMWEAVLVEASAAHGGRPAAVAAVRGERAGREAVAPADGWRAELVQAALEAVSRSADALLALRIEGIRVAAEDAPAAPEGSRPTDVPASTETRSEQPADARLRQTLQASLLGPGSAGDWPSDVEHAWVTLLETQPQWVRGVLLRLGRSVRVRRRLATHASEFLLRKLVELLAPGQAELVSESHLWMLEEGRAADEGGSGSLQGVGRFEFARGLVEGRGVRSEEAGGEEVPVPVQVHGGWECGDGPLAGWAGQGVVAGGVVDLCLVDRRLRVDVEKRRRHVYEGTRLRGEGAGQRLHPAGGEKALLVRGVGPSTSSVGTEEMDATEGFDTSSRTGYGSERDDEKQGDNEQRGSRRHEEEREDNGRSGNKWDDNERSGSERNHTERSNTERSSGERSNGGSSNNPWGSHESVNNELRDNGHAERRPFGLRYRNLSTQPSHPVRAEVSKPFVVPTFPVRTEPVEGPILPSAISGFRTASRWPARAPTARPMALQQFLNRRPARGHPPSPPGFLPQWKHRSQQTAAPMPNAEGKTASTNASADLLLRHAAPQTPTSPPTLTFADPKAVAASIRSIASPALELLASANVSPSDMVPVTRSSTAPLPEATLASASSPNRWNTAHLQGMGPSTSSVRTGLDSLTEGLRYLSPNVEVSPHSFSPSLWTAVSKPFAVLAFSVQTEAMKPLVASHLSIRAEAPTPLAASASSDQTEATKPQVPSHPSVRAEISKPHVTSRLSIQAEVPKLRVAPHSPIRAEASKLAASPTSARAEMSRPFAASTTPVRTEPVEGLIPLSAATTSGTSAQRLSSSQSTRPQWTVSETPLEPGHSSHALGSSPSAPAATLDKRTLWQHTLSHLLLETDAGFQAQPYLESLEARLWAHRGEHRATSTPLSNCDVPLGALWIRWTKFLHRGANTAWTPNVLQAWQELLQQVPGHLRESLMAAGTSATLRRSLACHAPTDALSDLATLFVSPRQLPALTALTQRRLFHASLSVVEAEHSEKRMAQSLRQHFAHDGRAEAITLGSSPRSERVAAPGQHEAVDSSGRALRSAEVCGSEGLIPQPRRVTQASPLPAAVRPAPSLPSEHLTPDGVSRTLDRSTRSPRGLNASTTFATVFSRTSFRVHASPLGTSAETFHLDQPVRSDHDVERLLWELVLSHLLLDCAAGFTLRACVRSVIHRLSLRIEIPASELALQAREAVRSRQPMEDASQALLDALDDAQWHPMHEQRGGSYSEGPLSPATMDASASSEAATAAKVLAHLDGTSPWPAHDIEAFEHQIQHLCAAAPALALHPLVLALEHPRAADRLVASLPAQAIRQLVHRLSPFDSMSVHACVDLMLSALTGPSTSSATDPDARLDESAHRQASEPIAQTSRQAHSPQAIAQRFILRHVFEEGRLFSIADFSRRLCAELSSSLNPAQPTHWRAALQRQLTDIADAQDEATAALARDIAQALSTIRDPEAPEPVTRTAWPMFAAPGTEPIYIANAGLVLLAPYLQRLFSMLKLTDQGAFVDHAAAQRAMQLAQFLVDGQPRSPEHALVLNKLLCDVPIEAPIDGQTDLEPHEQEAALGLLRAVIQHWKALGRTSVAGLRESFLQREGRLTHSDAGWQLKVEPKAFDMLIDQLPWGFSTVKFPWMKEILHVDWR